LSWQQLWDKHAYDEFLARYKTEAAFFDIKEVVVRTKLKYLKSKDKKDASRMEEAATAATAAKKAIQTPADHTLTTEKDVPPVILKEFWKQIEGKVILLEKSQSRIDNDSWKMGREQPGSLEEQEFYNKTKIEYDNYITLLGLVEGLLEGLDQTSSKDAAVHLHRIGLSKTMVKNSMAAAHNRCGDGEPEWDNKV
jgi:hypothetical protein